MRIQKSVLVPHSCQQMFELVDRCEDYPQFLPWCQRTTVQKRCTQFTEACLFIDFLHVCSHFTTRNLKNYPERMQLQLIDGPFRFFEGEWRFVELAQSACKVEFDLEYTFASTLLEKTVGPVFSKISSSFVDAFVKRAKIIYHK